MGHLMDKRISMTHSFYYYMMYTSTTSYNRFCLYLIIEMFTEKELNLIYKTTLGVKRNMKENVKFYIQSAENIYKIRKNKKLLGEGSH